jgi:hypothetical protein
MKARLPLAALCAVLAIPAAAQTTLTVPPGRSISATLLGTKAVARIAATPRIVEFQFGRKAQGVFRAYGKTEAMPPDRAFIVRARYDTEPPFARTEITLAGKQFGSRTVTVSKTRENPLVLESDEVSMSEARTCRERLTVCETSEWLREAR